MKVLQIRRYMIATIVYLYEFVDKWSIGLGGVSFIGALLSVVPLGAEPLWVKTCTGAVSCVTVGLLVLSLIIKRRRLRAIYRDALRASTKFSSLHARRRLDAYLLYGQQFDIEAATAFPLETKSAFNQELFAGTHWDNGEAKRASRNRTVLEKNPFCIAIDLHENGSPRLFSYAIPLSPQGEAIYMAGGLADLDFDRSHVAGPDDRYDTILIFALGRSGKKNVGVGLMNFVTGHLSWMVSRARVNGEIRPIRLIAQTEMGALTAPMQDLGFSALHQKSKDGHALVAYYLT